MHLIVRGIDFVSLYDVSFGIILLFDPTQYGP